MTLGDLRKALHANLDNAINRLNQPDETPVEDVRGLTYSMKMLTKMVDAPANDPFALAHGPRRWAQNEGIRLTVTVRHQPVALAMPTPTKENT